MHTFVIPVYKESPYLEQCIQSLLGQSVKSQIILTTSTPTDFSSAIAKKYGFGYFVNDKKGIANDWNFALSKVATSYATIAHQDDIYEPAYTALILKSMAPKGDKKTVIGFTDYNDLINDNIRKPSLNWYVKKALLFPFTLNKRIESGFLKKSLLLFGDPICCPSVTFNMDALQGFRFSPDFTVALDWYAWYQLAKQKGAFCFVNKKLVKHRIHPGSETTVKLSEGIRKQEELRMFKMIWGEKPAALLSWIYKLGHNDNKLQTDV